MEFDKDRIFVFNLERIERIDGGISEDFGLRNGLISLVQAWIGVGSMTGFEPIEALIPLEKKANDVTGEGWPVSEEIRSS